VRVEGQAGGRAAGRYAEAAFDAEVRRVRDAPAGTRNHSLNRAAFALGQLIAAGLLDESSVVLALTDAAAAAGLAGREIEATMRSGLRAGMQSPRAVPA
jgi:hypothetical protein